MNEQLPEIEGAEIARSLEVNALRQGHWREAFDLAILCVDFGSDAETQAAMRKYADLMISEFEVSDSDTDESKPAWQT